MRQVKSPRIHTVTLDSIVGGGQAIGTLESGKKAFVWGALPGETVEFQVTKSKSKFVEGYATAVVSASDQRISPRDGDSYLSTSPWQIMTPEAEQFYKAALIEEAFELHDIVLPEPITVYSDGVQFGYRNKVEFSWYGDVDEAGNETLDLAFFRRGGKGKRIVDGTSLAREEINELARAIRDLLRSKHVSGRSLKTLLIRCNQQGQCVWQLYAKDQLGDIITENEAASLPAIGGEIIYSDPKSPASRITERLASFGDIVLTDTILGVPFRYATEGFFQVNIPVYEHALRDMQAWVDNTSPHTKRVAVGGAAPAFEAFSNDSKEGADRLTGPAPSDLRTEDAIASASNDGSGETLDLYSGVGSIGLTIGGDNVTLVEINEDAVREMRRNITELGRQASAHAVLAPSEKALDYISPDTTIIVDPPRAGMHTDVIAKLLEAAPPRIIYLSCNPVTQARDVALLAETYGIRAHQGYNFFPRTPHIEHLVVLDLKENY